MALELQNLRKSYDDGTTYAVDDVSLRAERGELVVLLGESGCGKTTTLKTINRLIEPTSGRVLIDGVDTRTLDSVSLRRSIGYVFQGVGLFPHMTVAENVAVTPKLLGWLADRRLQRTRELLELVRLDPWEYAPMISSPGGVAARSPAHAREIESVDSNPRPLVGRSLTVGSKGFTEQYILAELLAMRLESAGATVDRLSNVGSTILFDAVHNGTVDVSVDYTGTIWTTIMRRTEPIERTATFIEVAAVLLRDYGVLTLGRLGYENAYVFAMTRDRAAALGVRSITDLEPLAGNLTIASDPEFFGRPEWVRLRDAYALDLMLTRGMDSTFMYGAVRDGQVDLITAYTTDGRIRAFDLVVLGDPRQAIPPYDAVLLMSPEAGADPDVVATLRPLLNAISAETMRTANMMVDVEGLEVDAAARFVADRVARR